MVKNPVWTVGLFFGAILAAILVFASNLYLPNRFSGQVADGLAERNVQSDYLNDTPLNIERSRDGHVDVYINKGITLVRKSLGFDSTEEDEYSLTVPRYDTLRRNDAWESWTETYEGTSVYVESRPDGPSYREDIMQSITKLTRASFGLTGERGAGKTALMFALKDQMLQRSTQTNRQFLVV